MALLAGTFYDPLTAGTVNTTSLLAMTAFDTTNLRLTFTAPANGTVLVRMRCAKTGAATDAQILLGVLESSPSAGTVRGRIAPMNGRTGGATTHALTVEGSFLVTGLTPSTSYTWDAAYGVELVVAATSLKWGGPNNTTASDAWGGFVYEIWETTNLLAGVHYDPATAVANKSLGTASVMTAFDTTNLRLTFTVPASGKVLVSMRCMHSGATSQAVFLLGILEGSTLRGRCAPITAPETRADGFLATSHIPGDATFLVTGLTPAASLTWDAAYGVELVQTANIKYGGPNNTTQDDAYGGFAFEIWAA